MNINTSKSFIHPIARQYFEKIQSAGGVVSDEKSINNFVIKLSKIIDPSLWVCWPLCSSQNIGTGTTAFSLGGLGNYEGILINGPTWGVEGITTGTDQEQVYTVLPTTEIATIIIVQRINAEFSSLYTRRLVGAYIGGFGTSLSCDFSSSSVLVDWPEGSGGRWQPGVPFRAESVFDFMGFGMGSNSTRFFQRNSDSLLTTTVAPSPIVGLQNFGIIGGGGSVAKQVTGAFCLYITADVSLKLSGIFNLYKQTLGQGLGLP